MSTILDETSRPELTQANGSMSLIRWFALITVLRAVKRVCRYYYLEVPDLRRSVDRPRDDVSSVGRQLNAVDADLFGRQHDVGDSRTLTGRRRRHS